MKPKVITIPPGVDFADLQLEREPVTRRLLYRPEPLATMAHANELDGHTMFSDEDLACWLVAEWYLAHRIAGGEPDPVAEEVLSEVTSLHATNIPALDPGGGREH